MQGKEIALGRSVQGYIIQDTVFRIQGTGYSFQDTVESIQDTDPIEGAAQGKDRQHGVIATYHVQPGHLNAKRANIRIMQETLQYSHECAARMLS
jgi:hypothetical protein